MNLLDIIVPQYKEDDTVFKKLLESINKQKNINFNDINIIIINDNSNTYLSNNLFKLFPKLNIKYIKSKINQGPSLTRQIGLDHSNSKYVTFIDADDMLDDENSLYLVLSCFNDTNADYIFTSFKREINVLGKIQYNNFDARNLIWLHGKYFKREIFKKYNIKFSNLRCFEDEIICRMIYSIKDLKSIVLNFSTYIWCDFDLSLTRQKSKYNFIVMHFDDYYNSPIIEYEFIKNNNIELANECIFNAMLNRYMALNSNLFEYEELKEMKNEYLNKIKSFILNHIDIFKSYDKNKAKEIFNNYILSYKKDNAIINITIDDFYKFILE